MRFRAIVEPPEPMRGLEIPPGIVESLGGGKRPRVVVSINGHSWPTRVAPMRGRQLIGVSTANRKVAGVEIGEEITVDIVLDEEPLTVTEPADLIEALNAEPSARQAFDRLTISQRRQHVRLIEQAKGADTRARRIRTLISQLHGPS